jgi:hypothetical protein
MLRNLFKKLSAYSQERRADNSAPTKAEEEKAALKNKALTSALCRQITPFGPLY